jgi:hypothetical protein
LALLFQGKLPGFIQWPPINRAMVNYAE